MHSNDSTPVLQVKEYHLPKANRSLSEKIQGVNKVITTIKDCRRGPYEKYPPKAKANIAKYAAIHGVAFAL